MNGECCQTVQLVLYHFIQFGRHASHPIFSDTGNDFFSIFPIFWNSLCFSHGQVLAELNEMVQYVFLNRKVVSSNYLPFIVRRATTKTERSYGILILKQPLGRFAHGEDIGSGRGALRCWGRGGLACLYLTGISQISVDVARDTTYTEESNAQAAECC